jgi:hypothetical protein
MAPICAGSALCGGEQQERGADEHRRYQDLAAAHLVHDEPAHRGPDQRDDRAEERPEQGVSTKPERGQDRRLEEREREVRQHDRAPERAGEDGPAQVIGREQLLPPGLGHLLVEHVARVRGLHVVAHDRQGLVAASLAD